MLKTLIGLLAMLLPVLYIPITETLILDCKNLEAAACATEFTNKFDKAIKSAYIASLNNVYTKYIEIYSAIVKELPVGDLHVEPLNLKIAEFSKKSKELAAEVVNANDAAALILQKFDYFYPDFKDIDFGKKSEDIYEELLEKYDGTHMKLLKFFLAQDITIADKVTDAWNSMYKDLIVPKNDKDNFEKVNTYYAHMHENHSDFKSFFYFGAMEYTIKFIDLNFSKVVMARAFEFLGYDKVTL